METSKWKLIKNTNNEVVLLNGDKKLLIQAYKNGLWYVQLQSLDNIIYDESVLKTKKEAIKIINNFKNKDIFEINR
jgi:hypothetical protein